MRYHQAVDPAKVIKFGCAAALLEVLISVPLRYPHFETKREFVNMREFFTSQSGLDFYFAWKEGARGRAQAKQGGLVVKGRQ